MISERQRLSGLGSEKGLFFPEFIPVFPENSDLRDMENYSNEEIAWHVMSPYVGDSIPENRN